MTADHSQPTVRGRAGHSPNTTPLPGENFTTPWPGTPLRTCGTHQSISCNDRGRAPHTALRTSRKSRHKDHTASRRSGFPEPSMPHSARRYLHIPCSTWDSRLNSSFPPSGRHTAGRPPRSPDTPEGISRSPSFRLPWIVDFRNRHQFPALDVPDCEEAPRHDETLTMAETSPGNVSLWGIVKDNLDAAVRRHAALPDSRIERKTQETDIHGFGKDASIDRSQPSRLGPEQLGMLSGDAHRGGS